MRQIRQLTRISALVMSLVFVAMSVVVQASWQCEDGTPCPPDCAMSHRITTPKAPGATTCSHCPQGPQVTTGDKTTVGCSSPKCELKISSKPTVSRSTQIYFEMPDVLPIALVDILPTVVRPIFLPSPRTLFPPPRDLPSHAPRGPPSLL